jgi:hypothetical protein
VVQTIVLDQGQGLDKALDALLNSVEATRVASRDLNTIVRNSQQVFVEQLKQVFEAAQKHAQTISEALVDAEAKSAAAVARLEKADRE